MLFGMKKTSVTATSNVDHIPGGQLAISLLFVCGAGLALKMNASLTGSRSHAGSLCRAILQDLLHRRDVNTPLHACLQLLFAPQRLCVK